MTWRLSSYLVGLPGKAAKTCTAHDRLVNNGYIRHAATGTFNLLPLGLMVQNKIQHVIRTRLHEMGAVELSLSSLTDRGLWVQTGRIHSNPDLFVVGDKYVLAPTHEEEITCVARDQIQSYKQLPLLAYQISRKYRNEKRPRAGLLRAREFVMKDMYSFDRTSHAAHATYHRVLAKYRTIFQDLELPIAVARADPGSIGGSVSHEFHVLSPMGEDSVLHCAKCSYCVNSELGVSADTCPSGQCPCPECGADTLHRSRAIELGHTFLLGTKYSHALKSTYTNETGERVLFEMGCYGLGVSRLIAALADTCTDTQGLVWPRQVSPFDVVVVSKCAAVASQLVQLLHKARVSAVWDDRSSQFAVVLKNSFALGFPIVLVAGQLYDDKGVFEVKARRQNQTLRASLHTVVDVVQNVLCSGARRWLSTNYTQLSNRRVLRFSGHECTRFLNGLVSNKIEPQKSGGVYTGVFNAKGRVIADAFVYFGPESAILMDVDSRVSETLYKTFLLHRLRTQVDIELVCTGLLKVWAVWGGPPDQTFTGNLPRNKNLVGLCADRRAPFFATRLVLAPDTEPSELYADATRSDLQSYDIRRYQYGIPEGSYEIPCGRALPLEYCLDYMAGIDFEKGCYLGQELTIRSHHHGVIRKRVIPVLLSHQSHVDEFKYDPLFPPVGPYQSDEHVDLVRCDSHTLESARSKPGTLLAAIGNVGLASVRLDQFAVPESRFKLAGSAVYVSGFQPFWWPLTGSNYSGGHSGGQR